MDISSIGAASAALNVNVGQTGSQGSPATSAASPTAAASPAQTPPASAPASNPGDVATATRQVAEMVQSRASNLVFSLDDDSGQTVVRIVDAQTDELIRQIPSEEILSLAKAIEDYQSAKSLLIEEKA